MTSSISDPPGHVLVPAAALAALVKAAYAVRPSIPSEAQIDDLREAADALADLPATAAPIPPAHPEPSGAGVGAVESGDDWQDVGRPSPRPDAPCSGADTRERIARIVCAAAMSAHVDAEDDVASFVDDRWGAYVDEADAILRLIPAPGQAEAAPLKRKSDGGQSIIDGLNDAIAWAKGDDSRARLLRVEDGNVVEVSRPAPGAATDESLSQAARDVLAERRRQVEEEGWTPQHDDNHTVGDMCDAAAAYAIHAGRQHRPKNAPPIWPWRPDQWKPTTRRRDLVKAGALILAEIERLDRAPSPRSDSSQGE